MRSGSDERRVVLLLAAGRDVRTDDAGATLRSIVDALSGRSERRGVQVRVGTRIPNDPLGAVAEATGRSLAPVNTIVQVTGTSDEALLDVISGFADRCGGAFDRERSVAALGTVRRVTEGVTGPVMLALAARRRPTLTHADFHQYWIGKHAPLALSLMPPDAAARIGYEQLHADEAPSAHAAEAAGIAAGGYAGVLQVLCRAPEDFLSIAAEPSFAAKIAEDEQNFAEQSDMRGAFLRLAS